MKVLLVNPPYKKRIMRRYGSSDNTHGHAVPPLELCSVATALRHWNKAEVKVIDAIAEGINAKEAKKQIKGYNPELIIYQTGFESYHHDVAFFHGLGIKTACFGYIPSLYPKETIKLGADYVICGEPEFVCSELVARIAEDAPLEHVKGLAYWDGRAIHLNPARNRINFLDNLPFPDRSLLKNELYNIPFFGRPFTSIQTVRGCAFSCTHCTHFEGREFYAKSPEKVIEELKDISDKGIKYVRFLDHNFTYPKERAIKICNSIADNKLDLTMACLSRADLIDEEVADALSNAGCSTVFLGFESCSEKTLNLLNKRSQMEMAEKNVKLLRKNNIEVVGWFIFGAPWESEEDFRKNMEFAKRVDPDFAIASVLDFFPGTELFEKYKNNLDFSLAPYSVTLKDKKLAKRAASWEKRFYTEFYTQPRAMARLAKRAFIHPVDSFHAGKAMASYLLSSNKDLY